MNNAVVLPIFVPVLTGILLILFMRSVRMQRWISGIGSLVTLLVTALLFYTVSTSGLQFLNMGGWAAPYGIVFVADTLASLLVLVSSVISVACTFYAFHSITEEREKHHFYVFFQFLMAGVNGSFLTGDLFNLFVCFELMLISSYALLVLGNTERQLRESLKYVLINMVSSSLLVIAIGYLYSVTGTINMAHLSVRVAEVGQDGILGVIAVLFLLIFSIKAGLFLFFWLSGSYAAPPALVTALFAGLLTKVGLYAIVRVFTLIFYHDPGFTHAIIGWMSGATMLLGVIGAIAYKDVNKILVYNVVAGVGFVAFGMAAGNKLALEGLMFYLIHDMIIKTLLFLLGGAIIAAAGTSNLSNMGGMIQKYPLLGWMFFITTLALAGVPPLSGFPGKLMLFEGGLDAGLYVLTAIAVIASFIMLYSLLRVFIYAFFGSDKTIHGGTTQISVNRLLAPAGFLFILIIGIGVFAEVLYPAISTAAHVLIDPNLYINNVLKEW